MRLLLFRLFAQSGRLVHELEKELDGVQLAEYAAYYQLEPFGEERADLRSAQQCAVLANRWRTKGERRWSILDFMLFSKRPEKKRKSKQELIESLRAAGRAFRDRKGPRDGH